MSSGIYAPDKALAHPQRIEALRKGQIVYPAHVHLILTNICNQNCPGCAYRQDGYTSSESFDDRSQLSTQEVCKILQDCRDMDCRGIELTGGGEPTVHPDCATIMEYAQSLGLHTALITNGTRLERVLEPAVRSQWVRVSLDAATAETYKLTHGKGPEVWRKVLSNIEALVKLRNKTSSNVTLGAAFTVQKANWKDTYLAIRLAYMLGLDNIRISALFTPEKDKYHVGHYRQTCDLIQKAVEASAFTGPTFKIHNRFSEKLSDLSGPPNYRRCYYQQFTTYLGADGNVYRCCVYAYNQRGLIGNVRDYGSFKRLWDAADAQGKFALFDARGCQVCQFNDRNAAIANAVESSEELKKRSVSHPYFV